MKKTVFIILWLAGLALLLALVARQGFARVGGALAALRWGVPAVCGVYLGVLALNTLSWRRLLPPGQRPAPAVLAWARWVCDAINSLLPAAQLGGDLVRARMLLRHGVTGIAAGASVITDITAGVFTEILFSLLGIVLLMHYNGRHDLVLAALLSVLLFVLFVLLFFLAQHLGFFGRLAHWLKRLLRAAEWNYMVGTAEMLDAAILETYRRRRDFSLASFWRMLGWLAGCGEVWTALFFLGHPVPLAQAVMLESLGQAVRHVMFAVPGALGVQEGGFIMLGGVVGLSPETALTLSLVKRLRELLMGLPPLLIWYWKVK